MNVLIPMAGAGARFAEAGYALHKPVIPVSVRRRAGQVPMVVAAIEDLPVDARAADLTLVVRDFHLRDGVDAVLRAYYPQARCVVVDRLTEGQAATCLLARAAIDNDAPLLIAACDNGMDIDQARFAQGTETADVLVFTFRNNPAVLAKPQAYGWLHTEGDRVTGTAIKRPVSATPMRDHAVVGTFWFRRGRDFVTLADRMIAAEDRINGEFYVDQVVHHALAAGLDVRVLEVDRYICWGTPADYEAYEASLAYWRAFAAAEDWVR